MDKRIIAFVTAGLFATAASAGGDKSFSDLDKDGDGQISQQEASGKLKDNWEQVDADGDGNVDQSEFSVFEQMQEEPAGAGQSGGGATGGQSGGGSQ